MTPTPAPAAKSLDFKKSLLETFFVNESFGLWEWGTLWKDSGFAK
jgi:hypothetical protein